MTGPTKVFPDFSLYLLPIAITAYIVNPSKVGVSNSGFRENAIESRLLTFCFPHLMLVYFQPLIHYGIHIKT